MVSQISCEQGRPLYRQRCKKIKKEGAKEWLPKYHYQEAFNCQHQGTPQIQRIQISSMQTYRIALKTGRIT